MTRQMTAIVLGTVLAAGMAATANASVLATETFSYTDGNLVGNATWSAHSGAGVLPIQVTSGAAVLAQGSGTREDANLAVSAMAAGQTYYAGFDLTNTGGNQTVYFAHFQQGPSTFRGRVFITAGASGDYTVGLSDTSTLNQTWATALTFGATYRVIVSYDFDTGTNKLWVDAVSEASTSLTTTGIATTAIAGFGLRQASANSSQTIDNLTIATSFAEVVPAPGSLALLGLGGLVATRRR